MLARSQQPTLRLMRHGLSPRARRHRSWVFAVGLVIATALPGGCAPRTASPSAATEPAPAGTEGPGAPATQGAEPAEPTSQNPSEAERAIARTLTFVAQVRELPALEPVVGQQLSRDDMVAHVKRTLREEVPPEVLKATNEFLYLAGVVAEDFDYEQALLNVLGTELAGFYDPKEQRMYLGQDLGGEEQRATLLHELVHALQDQHYGLAALTKWQPDSADRMSALHGLAEGDATSAMLDALMFGSGRTSLDLPEALMTQQIEQMQNADPSVPGIVKRSVVAPYVDGLRFVHALRARGGFAAVDAAWKAPPRSTEQMLHPEKYFADEEPVVLPVPAAPAGGPSALLYRDVEGEQGLRLLLEEWLPRQQAYLAASDWAGDRLALYAEGDVAAFAWHIRFDTQAAAKRAYDAVQSWVMPKGKRGPRETCRERGDRGPIAASLDGMDIAIVAGPYSKASGAAKSTGTCGLARGWLHSIHKG